MKEALMKFVSEQGSKKPLKFYNAVKLQVGIRTGKEAEKAKKADENTKMSD